MFDFVAGEGEMTTLPCLATDPHMTDLHLQKCDGQPLPNSLRYSSSIETGITLEDVRKDFEGCYVCVGTLEGNTVKSDNINSMSASVRKKRKDMNIGTVNLKNL